MTPSPPSISPGRAYLALALLVPVPTIGTLMAMVFMPGPVGQGVFFAAKVWVLLFPIVWHVLVEGGRPSLSPLRRGGMAMGLITGLAIIAIMFAAYFLLGRHWIDADHVAAMAAQNGIGTPARSATLLTSRCSFGASAGSTGCARFIASTTRWLKK